MSTLTEINTLLTHIFEQETLIAASMSAPFQEGDSTKSTLRALLLQGEPGYQLTEHRLQQARHHNLSKEKCLHWLREHLSKFKQTFLYTDQADYHLLRGKRGHWTILKKAPTRRSPSATHNREKHYIWQEGTSLPFLVHLGLMNAEGKVYPAKRDKFRQINRFLEMIEDVLPALKDVHPIRIVDFGCGNAYLTFALYHFLKITKNRQIDMIGLDLKKEVIERCQRLAYTLGYQELRFIEGNIANFEPSGPIHLMISLHACDTATDAALAKAISHQARVILCVPCCQHELMHQVKQEALHTLLKQGILKERFSALATDAARAQLLEVCGYQTQVMEFIDLEHTPKNLLIRALRRDSLSPEKRLVAWQAYVRFKQHLHIDPTLERILQGQLPA